MIIKTEERITAHNYERVLNQMLRTIADDEPIILEMSETQYIGSAFLRAVIIGIKSLEAKKMPRLKMKNVSRQVIETLDTAGFLDILDIE